MQKRNKTQLITQYLDQNIGIEVTPQQIADAVETTIQTVYTFIRSNASRFETVKRGTFKINSSQNTLFLNNEGTI
jgi:Mg/Co/Ni transporter MgtE